MPRFSSHMLVSLAMFAAVFATASVAAGLTSADAVKYRIDHMKGLGGAAKALGDQMRSGSPDPAVVKAQTAKIVVASQAIPSWFPHGSGSEAGVKTRALPVIWTDSAGFAAAQKAFAAQAAKLDAAAAGGDMAATGSETKALFGACKGCHDKYRGPEV
jgi:cytochrome c556